MSDDRRVESLLRQARALFPNGHPDFAEHKINELVLHDQKNGDYAGDDDPLGNFHRVSQILGLYDLDPAEPVDYCLILAMKQVDAIMSLRSRGTDGGVEDLRSRAKDVSVYFTILSILLDEQESETEGEQLSGS